MKRTRRLLSLMVCIVLAAGMAMAAAERDPWDCPNCGRKGNTGNFCGSCGEPAAEATPEPTDAPVWSVLYTMYYRDEAGGILNSDTLMLSGSGTITYTLLANDALVPAGYVLAGEESAEVTVTNGKPDPSRVTFVYRSLATATPSPSPTPTPAPTPTPGPTPNVKAGDYVTFGHYEQDNNTANGQEPIEWLVLEVEEGKALLLSRSGLDAKEYNTEWTVVTWEKCSLRGWLNGEFMNRAFSSAEQAGIEETEVDNSAAQCYSGWSTSGGKNTRDKVYLLSYGESNKYLGVTKEKDDNIQLCTSATAYAKAQGAWTRSNKQTTEGEYTCRWWLRSPGYYQYNAAGIDTDGSLDFSSVLDTSLCVRPALWVNLESIIF